jgi:hypothetical protein
LELLFRYEQCYRTTFWERVSNAPFLTVNEKRVAVGYGAVTGGDALQN